jgi:HlyD family secretion protein
MLSPYRKGFKVCKPTGFVMLALVGLVIASTALGQDQRAAEQALRKWDATAPGRVEPRTQEIHVVSSIADRIAEVRVAVNDKVSAGDLLVRLDDEEARARLASAEAQVDLRQRLRDEEKKKGPAALTRAVDDESDAARAVAQAWERLDSISAPKDTARSAVEDAAVGGARSALVRAIDQLKQARDKLRKAKDDAGLPMYEEAQLEAARADLTLAEAGLQKTRVRAPAAGSVLAVRARVGEMALPSPEQWLVLLGDVTGLSVRAELDEHDYGKIHVGQRVVVRAYAFPGREFDGRVRSIGRYVGPGRLNSQGQRNKLADADVTEVVVDLTDPGPLAVGMQADVYFSSEGS